MPHRKPLLALLNSYQASDRMEASERHVFKVFVEENSDCFLRSCLKGHVTASSWIVSPDFSHVLLNHHRKYDLWMQFGGHADGNADVKAVAMQENEEETGLSNIKFMQETPFDVGIRWVPPHQDIPEHVHYDVCFLCTADMDEQVERSERESVDVKWVPLDEVKNYLAEDDIACQRFLTKTLKLAAQKAQKVA